MIVNFDTLIEDVRRLKNEVARLRTNENSANRSINELWSLVRQSFPLETDEPPFNPDSRKEDAPVDWPKSGYEEIMQSASGIKTRELRKGDIGCKCLVQEGIVWTEAHVTELTCNHKSEVQNVTVKIADQDVPSETGWYISLGRDKLDRIKVIDEPDWLSHTFFPTMGNLP